MVPSPEDVVLVVMESPYAGRGATEAERAADHAANVAYAQQCMLDCLRSGEAPMVSHLLYPQVLDDTNPEDRERGINAGLAYHRVASVVAYIDRGFSDGMTAALRRALKHGHHVALRSLHRVVPEAERIRLLWGPDGVVAARAAS